GTSNFNTLGIGGSNTCLLSTGSAPTWGSCAVGNGTNFWTTSSDGKALVTINTTQDLLLGGVATSSATFHVYGSTLAGTNPVASISGNTSYSGLVVDNIGGTGNKGDIFTASASGLTRFVIQNNGNVTFNSYGQGVSQFNSATSLLSSGQLDLSSSTYVKNQLAVAN